MARPDRAQINIGVATRTDSSQTAVSQNAQKLETTLTRLRKLLGANAEINTISFNVTPNYRYPSEGPDRKESKSPISK